MYDYINEAFKRLDLLNEDVFEPTAQGIKDLSDFLDGDDVDTTVDVIDPEANTEEELSDSYVGKVIVNCNVCHSHVFEDKDNIVIDDDGSVNVDKQCPYCGEASGFVVIGEIKPFTAETAEADTTVDNSADTESDTDVDTQIDISTSDEEDREPVTESWGSDSISSLYQEIVDFLKSKGYKCSSPTCRNYLWSVVDYIRDSGECSVEQWYEDTKMNYPEDFDLFECSLKEGFEKATIESTDDITTVDVGEDGEVSINVAPRTAEASLEVTEGEADVVTDETISPLSDETQAEIEAENGIAPAEDVDTATEDGTDTDTEETTETDVSADETTDIDIEEVDEESMDELGESYMKRVYDNVDTFKTTNISGDDTRLVVEGVITFASGIQKNTGFIFEASKATPTGKVTFVGLNEHFSKSKRAFLLSGTVNEKKLVFESLNYRYSVDDKLISGRVNRK